MGAGPSPTAGPLDFLNSILTTQVQFQAKVNLNGPSNPPQQLVQPLLPNNVTLGTAAANNAAGGSDSLLYQVVSINASSSQTIDLQSFTDALNRASSSLARVKGIFLWLLSPTNDTVTPGTLASSVTWDGSLANSFLGWLGGTNPTITLSNGESICFAAPGSAGKTVDGTHHLIKLVNNDGALTAKVLMVVVGGTS